MEVYQASQRTCPF